MQLHELQRMARVATGRAAITPTPQAEFYPPAAEPVKAEPVEEEPELREVLANTPWSSILVPFAIGLASIAVSLILVFTTN